MPAGMGEQPTNKLGLRHRMVRVAEVDGEHKLVLFGRPTSGGPVVSRYTRLLDRQSGLNAKIERLRARLGETAGEELETGRPYYLKPDSLERLSIEEMVETLAAYDVVSFDIFDTALFRAVERPNDVFRIMGSRLGVDRFARIRKGAEGHARMENNRNKGSREVTLREIYAVMEERYAAPPAWEEMEQALEIELSRPNPYIREVFDQLIAMGKTVVFMSDMYLPRETLEEMLVRNGYAGYEKIYVSNEYLRRKGDGTLQQVLLDNYSETSIVHVGDVYEADVEQSEKAGLAAVHNPDQHQLVREPDMGNLAGSFYGALVDNSLGSGTWSEGLHYTHGYRVGGILALGFAEFIEQVVRDKSVDKVLFCGRDCDVLSRIYERDYGSVDSAYIDISRYAISGITLDLNFDDYVGRSFFRWFGESRNSKTIEQLMNDTGFGYLVPYLEQADIERFLFPASANRRKLEQFFWDHKAVIEEHNRTSVAAAKSYFENAVGDAQRVLVVDIGWSGTCLTALRHFFRTAMADRPMEVFGALMCTSRSEQLTDTVSDGFISPYIYSPLGNMDLTRFMMPGGRNAVRRTDLLHHPLEYLFTEVASSVVGYGFDEDGKPVALRGNNAPSNVEQISEMQRGIEDFVTAYLDYSRAYADIRPVSPYVAFNPLRAAIQNEAYLYEVYKDFIYDATPALFGEETHTERFGDLFSLPGATMSNVLAPSVTEGVTPRRIVFISPEMIYAGAPRSLLRMCKVAAAQGFEPVVWTAKPGPFAKEFEAYGFRVEVVRTNPARPNKVFNRLPDGVELVVCNTVVTDDYVRALEGRVPVVWYVREASNLPDFFRANPERRETLRHSKSVCVVSEYAAAAVAKYADGPIEVVHNSVEDVSDLAGPYEFAGGGKHRFIQMGTIEHRKGYDLFVEAYKSLPDSYRKRAELHFAGGFINSGSSFSSYLFGQIEGEEGIHFHGLVSDERRKIELMSRMDTVVVASRDESFSLVALEGAMLSKPLIVTENVGAKYVVDEDNGLVIEAGSVEALRDAFVAMMDKDEDSIRAMGSASRRSYEERASMDVYHRELGAMFNRRIEAGVSGKRRDWSRLEAPSKPAKAVAGKRRPRVIVSLTSIPTRTHMLGACIDSLLHQTMPADQVVLWLSVQNFPGRDTDLPEDLLAKVGDRFRIAWVDGDIAPHKKYFYAMQENPDDLIITVDDDVVYSENLVESLYQGHLENPHAIISERANLIMFRPDGSLREYDGWIYNCQFLRGTPSYQLLPTGIAGVLYPPGALPEAAFDLDAIGSTSLRADDLWLKIMATLNGYPVWMPRKEVGYETIEEVQSVGLWRANSFQGGNDAALDLVLDHVQDSLGVSREILLRRIRGIAADGHVIGADEIDLEPLG